MSTSSLVIPPSFSRLRSIPSLSPLCLPRASALVESPHLALPITVFPASCDQHLRAACHLRVRTFYHLRQTYRREEYLQYLTDIEFEALKEKIHGQRTAFGKVQCVLATLPSTSIEVDNDESSSFFKIGTFDDQVVVGSLDINQTKYLPNELSGSRPEGDAAELRRGYLSNVCVAKQLHRKGIGKSLVMYAKRLALSVGITDLYTHVVVGNVSAEKLYAKCGFEQEGEEKPADAKLAGRPPHLLLWVDLTRG